MEIKITPEWLKNKIENESIEENCEARGPVMTNKPEELELKLCPFCGVAPVFPEAKDVYGTCYDAGCEKCGIATISIQIIDCFDRPRSHVHDSWDNKELQYGAEYIEVARQEAFQLWNSRSDEEQAKQEQREKDIKTIEEHLIDRPCLADDLVRAIRKR